MTLGVRVRAIFLDEVAIGAREQAPIEIAQVITRIVLTIFGELGRETCERRAVQPGHESLDDGAGQQLKRADPRQNFRVDKAGRAGRCVCGRRRDGLVFDRSGCFSVPPHSFESLSSPANRTTWTCGTYRSIGP